MKFYVFNLSNYYGDLTAVDDGKGNYRLELDSWDLTSKQTISKELFELLIKELEIKETIEN